MNSSQAKNLNMPLILSRIGYEPVLSRKGGTELWYHSPFRTETEPSFVVSPGHQVAWVWNDFGDIGGTIIDFAMRYKNFHRVKEALDWLESINGRIESRKQHKKKNFQPTLFSFNQQTAAAKPPKIFENQAASPQLKLISVKPIENPVILQYLTGKRHLSARVITRYLLEILYLHVPKDRQYFAFGMQNNSGGYEIRAASDDYVFKSVLGGRDITHIAGASDPHQTLNVFEGMTDFLSLLTLYNVEQLSGDSLIMHSVSSFNRVKEFLQHHSYRYINTFLDNDRVGEDTTLLFLKQYGDIVSPQNHLYVDYSDLNAALIANFVVK